MACRDLAARSVLRVSYQGRRPTRLGKFVNGGLAWLSGLGLTADVLLRLQVRGRHSGLLHTNVLVVAKDGGQSYMVLTLGDGSEWGRNVRAAERPSSSAADRARLGSSRFQRRSGGRS